MQGEREGRGRTDGFVEACQQRGAGVRGVRDPGGEVVTGANRVAVGQTHLLREPLERVLVGGPDLRTGQSETVGDPGQQLLRDRAVDRRFRRAVPRVGEQCVVVPHRLAIGAPVQRNLPARQRLSRIPLTLPALDQPLGRPPRLQAGGQIGRALTLVRAVGGGRPLLGDLVVDRHERRLAADGEPDVGGGQTLVDLSAHRADLPPRLVGVGQGDARVLVHAGDGVGELQHRFARLGAATDRCCAGRVRGRGQGNVAFAGEQARRRVQSDPARAGDVHLGPCVQVGEVGGWSGRPVERFDVGSQLHQVAGHEAGGQPQSAQDRHQQPGGVPARAHAGAQRVIGCLDTGFHPDAVGDVGVDGVVEPDQNVDGAGAFARRDVVRCEVAHPGAHQLAGARTLAVLVHRAPVRPEVVGQRPGIAQPAGRPGFGPLLDEEVERVDDLQVGDQPDGDRQSACGFGEHQPGEEVPHGVLLPVDEVLSRLDTQGVRLDGCAAVGSRAQSHHVRVDPHQAVKGVAGPMLQRHFDAHNRRSNHTRGICAARPGEQDKRGVNPRQAG